MQDNETTIKALKDIVSKFINEREWEQFHSPKNLSMSIAIEASELMELYQWLSLKEAENVMKKGETRSNAIDEIADVLIYSISFCISNKIDIAKAISGKMKKNIAKYPKNKFKGNF